VRHRRRRSLANGARCPDFLEIMLSEISDRVSEVNRSGLFPVGVNILPKNVLDQIATGAMLLLSHVIQRF
jgi:hypothetical protein